MAPPAWVLPPRYPRFSRPSQEEKRTLREDEHSLTRTVHCIKLDKEAEGLDFPPAPGKLGERIYASVSKQAWQAWLAHQTMLINENQLKLNNPEARKFLETEMESYFFGEGSAAPAGYIAPE